MLNKINIKNILNSIWIGVLIIVLIHFALNKGHDYSINLFTLITGGAIGFVIGTITEAVTAFLPKKIAGTVLFFLISNLLSILVTVLVLFLLHVSGIMNLAGDTFRTVLLIAVPVVAILNLFELIWYKRANRKLLHFQKKMDDSE